MVIRLKFNLNMTVQINMGALNDTDTNMYLQ